MTRNRWRALRACIAIAVGSAAVLWLPLEMGSPAAMLVGFWSCAAIAWSMWAVAKLRCPGCTARLVHMHDYNNLLLLWLIRKKCVKCGRRL